MFGQPGIFYTRRVLEQVKDGELKAYLKEAGIWHFVTGCVFLLKALLDKVYPYSKSVLAVFLILLVICCIFLARVNEKYQKKEN